MTPSAMRATIEARQLAALGAMILELRGGNPFYGPRLESAGLIGEPASIREFVQRIGFTTKTDLVDDQLAHPPFGTNLTYPIDRYTRYNQTSGTTGVPMRWLDTPESWGSMVDCWVRVLRESGVMPGDRIFFAFSFGPFLGFWTAFDAGTRYGCLCIPGGGMSSAARLQAIIDNQATVLCCTPTYALRLGEVAQEERTDLAASRIRLMIVAGEPGAGVPAVRQRIERLWPGARVKDHHGMTEVGPVTYECAARSGVLHVMEDAYLPEVIDPESGTSLAPGATGELALTNLGRIASPLLRYRTGDLVKWSGRIPCLCGSYEMALEGGILGRTDDMVVIRGVNVHPGAVDAIVRRFDSVVEYRATVSKTGALADLRLEIEPAVGCADPANLASEVEAAFRTALNLRVPVAVAPQNSLPRFEMKARRWIKLGVGEPHG